MSENKKPCIFNLHTYCLVADKIELEVRYGSIDFIKVYCGMCVKSMYAKAKHKLVNKFSVVNTL